MCFILLSSLSLYDFERTRRELLNCPVVHTGNLDQKFIGELKICCSALSNMPAGGLVQKSFSFFFFILKYKLAAFGLPLLRESEGNTSAAEVNHKRGVEGIKVSASTVFQTSSFLSQLAG